MIEKIIVIAALSSVGSCLATISGFGLGTVLTPLMLFLVPYQPAIVFVALVHWFHEIVKTFLFRKHIDWSLFFLFGLSGMIGSFLGALFIGYNADILSFLFGFFLIIYSSVFLLIGRWQLHISPPKIVAGGFTTGFCAGIFGIRGELSALFLASCSLPKEVYLATIASCGLLFDSTRLATYLFLPIHFDNWLWIAFFAALPAVTIGAFFGRLMVNKIPQDRFRTIIAIFLIMVGIKLIAGFLNLLSINF